MSVTLVLPTMNRPMFVRRTLQYFFEGNLESPIIIADGSDSEFAAENSDIVSEFVKQGLSITYFHLHDTSFVRRLYAAAKIIDTPMMQLVADDDFTSPEFVDAAAKILTTDLSCSAVVGATTSFQASSIPGDEIHLSPVINSVCRQEADGLSRILWFEGERRGSLFYAQRRTSLWREITTSFCQIEDAAEEWRDHASAFLLGNLYEILQDHLSLISGKVRSVPNIMMCRQYHQGNAGGQMAKASDQLSILREPRFPKLAQIFISAISEKLTEISLRSIKGEQRLAEALLFLRISPRLDPLIEGRIRELGSSLAGAAGARLNRYHPPLVIRLLRYALYRWGGTKTNTLSTTLVEPELKSIRTAVKKSGNIE